MIVAETMMRMQEPRPTMPGSRVKIDGIIGFDIIRQLDLELDYGDGVLRLRNPASSRPDAHRNMFWVGLPVIQIMSTDGVPLHFGLDTGAQLTFVTETLLDKLQLAPARIESRRVGGLGGEVSLRASGARIPDSFQGCVRARAGLSGSRFAGRCSWRRCLEQRHRADRHD